MSAGGEMPGLQERLSKAAPRFPKHLTQRVNRRAIMFLLAMLILLGLAGVVIWHGPGNTPGQSPPAKRQAQDQVSLPKFPVNPMADLAAGPAISPDQASFAADDVPPPAQQVDEGAPQRRPAILPEDPMTDLYPTVRTATPAQLLRERRSQRQSDAAGSPRAAEDGDPAIRTWTEGLARSAELLAKAAGPDTQAGASTKPATADGAAVARRLPALDQRLLRGTYIPCVLNNRIITDVPGFAACTVSAPVYSGNGRRLLLPPGTRILGSYSTGDLQNERLAMVWDRILTPDGVEVDLANPGVDSMGSAGHPGRYTAHWGQRIGSAVLVSLISDAFKYVAEQEGPRRQVQYPNTGQVVTQPFESNTAKALQRLAEQSVAASGRRPPTLTLAAGARLSIYVIKDVDFRGLEAP